MLVHLTGRAELLHPPVDHHGEPVGHRERFLLVVRDEEEGDPDLALDALELDLELAAKLGVERAERLVEQEDVRRENQRTPECDPLLLAARELMRLPTREVAQDVRARASR